MYSALSRLPRREGVSSLAQIAPTPCRAVQQAVSVAAVARPHVEIHARCAEAVGLPAYHGLAQRGGQDDDGALTEAIQRADGPPLLAQRPQARGEVRVDGC